MKSKQQFYSGLAVLLLTIVFSFTFLDSNITFRLLYGLAFGYVVARGRFAFSGAFYRLFHYGSAKTIVSFIYLIQITIIATGLLLLFFLPSPDLSINPVNFMTVIGGVILGGTLVASKHTPTRCASGVYVSYPTSISTFFIAIFFMGLGVLTGSPLQKPNGVDDTFITKSIVTSSNFSGYYLPDIFNNKFLGITFAIIISLIYLHILKYLANKYELDRIKKNTHNTFYIESIQETEQGLTLFEDLFVDYFSRRTTVALLGIITTFVFFKSNSFFGFITPTGTFAGKVLIFFGVPLEYITSYTRLSPLSFTTPFYKLPFTMQNYGLFIGSLIYKLTSCSYFHTFKMSKSTLYSVTLGSFIIGIASRLVFGCVIGSSYASFLSFSLSAWILIPSTALGGFITYPIHNYLSNKKRSNKKIS